MPITVELQKMHSYSLVLPVVAGIMGVIVLGTIIFFIVKALMKPSVNAPREITVKDREQIKLKYINMLNALETKCRRAEISNRKAHLELSKIARDYVYETTGVKVQNYTLNEIKGTNMPGLYNVVSECYAPEFSIDKNGDIYTSISKARKVVEGWN